MKKCINCNASIGDNLKFCPYCHKGQKNFTSDQLNPFQKYTERTSNIGSKEESLLQLYDKKQKLWNKLFFVSLLIEVATIIISCILPINNINEPTSYIVIALLFLIIFTFFMSYIYRKNYNKLFNKLHHSNQSKTTDFATPTQTTSSPAINYIVGGKYVNEFITCTTMLYTSSSPYFNKHSISSYTILDSSNKDSNEYSFWKGALGVALLGDIGAIAGINGKKIKERYLIAIEWKDGEKSLILINDEYYKVFVKSMF